MTHIGRPPRPRQLIHGKIYFMCTACLRWLPLERFFRLSSTPCGRASACKLCYRARRMEKRRAMRMAQAI